MPDYPLLRSSREMLREDLADRIMAAARDKAQRCGRSLLCAGDAHPARRPYHAFEKGGCANDGTGCLCECHDPKEATDG